jgi:hypothetical protein
MWSYAQSAQRTQEEEVRVQEQPSAPAPAAPMLQQAASPSPAVTFHNGELSIVAHNATLREILQMVGSQTGAIIEIPPGADERVAVQLGPGPARQVLASLLAGSDFNFIVLGSEKDPQVVAKVVLSPKVGPTGIEESSQILGQVAPNGLGAAVVRRRPGA